MAGELVSGGKQSRTIREDVVLAPGQSVDIAVFCVEPRRWEGHHGFKPSGVMVPESIMREMRAGADQARVWDEVARGNAAVGSDSPTGSLELALKSRAVQRELDEVHRGIVPDLPRDNVGFIFAYGSRPVGAAFFGRADLARELLPKLLDAYAVDLVFRDDWREDRWIDGGNAGDVFLQRIRQAGSFRADTSGSGSGIRIRAAGLVGDGVGFGGALVHFGCQIDERIVPLPGPVDPPTR
jgi:hypothetical protein